MNAQQPPRRRPPTLPPPPATHVHVTSDGTLDGTRVTLPTGHVLQHVQSIDIHLDAVAGTCTVTIGRASRPDTPPRPGHTIDYGPATIELHGATLDLRAGPTPRE